MRNIDTLSSHILTETYYKFLIVKAISQKAHHARKKAYHSLDS